MKYEIKKVLYVNSTLDSSESIMFSKGGMYKICLSGNTFEREFDEVVFTIQMQRDDQGRFNFVTEEALKHRKIWDQINEEEKQSKMENSNENQPT